MGGGTAGHLFPSVAVAQRLVDDNATDVLFIGAEGRLDGKILSEQDLPHQLIPAQPFPYGLSLKVVPAFWALWRSKGRCTRILREFKPDVVFGAGGYVSVAGVLAATRLRIPTVCHASDALPDRANRMLARWATRITTHYEDAAASFPPEKTTVVGQPVRREFAQASREDSRAQLGIPPDAFVLLMSGGSQGARTLNYSLLDALPALMAGPDMHIIHLCGGLDHDEVRERSRSVLGEDPRYQCHAFHEEPWLPISAADLSVTRGGASSLAETAAMGVPSIIVPYPYAAAHQSMNAQPLVKAGAAILVDNADVNGKWLSEQVLALKADRGRRDAMSQAARQVAKPNAARDIAGIIEALAQSQAARRGSA